MVFSVMAVLLVDSRNSRVKRQTETQQKKILQAASNLRRWADTLRQDLEAPEIISKEDLDTKLKKLVDALDKEDYESAAVLRDEIEKLKQELNTEKDA